MTDKIPNATIEGTFGNVIIILSLKLTESGVCISANSYVPFKDAGLKFFCLPRRKGRTPSWIIYRGACFFWLVSISLICG